MMLFKRLMCWYFGHNPESKEYGSGYGFNCARCGYENISYEDMVNDSWHEKVKQFFVYWLFRKWWPEKCEYCGHRFKHDDSIDHIPF